MKKFAKLTIVAIVALWFVGTANAVMIKGEIGLIGFGETSFDPMTATSVPPPSFLMVSTKTLDFVTYAHVGDLVTFVGFIFEPMVSPIAAPLWTVGDFSFDLYTAFATRSRTNLVLEGTGELRHSLFDNTPGVWSMSIDSHGSSFGFSSGTSAVPEASTLMLLGTGLIGVAFYTRRRK